MRSCSITLTLTIPLNPTLTLILTLDVYNIIIIIIIMEKTEAGLRGLCIREIDVRSQILVTQYYSKHG